MGVTDLVTREIALLTEAVTNSLSTLTNQVTLLKAIRRLKGRRAGCTKFHHIARKLTYDRILLAASVCALSFSWPF